MMFNVGCTRRYRARDLRNYDVERVPCLKHPGLYRWYARADDIKNRLLDSGYIRTKIGEKLTFYEDVFAPFMNKSELIPSLYVNEIRYYCIYIGIASSRSLYTRVVKEHINEDVTEDNVLSKAGKDDDESTFRESVSSLVAGDLSNNPATNRFINRLIVEFYADSQTVEEITDDEKQRIKDEEADEIEQYLTPLNIVGHRNNPILVEYIERLRQLRHAAGNVALRRFHKRTVSYDDDLEFPYLPKP